MCDARFIEFDGFIDQIVVRVSQHPREAVIEFNLDGQPRSLQLINPRPLSALMEVFDDCWSIRVIDKNLEEGNCLEFGRYRVEFWDEDGPAVEFLVDAASQSAEA